MRTAGRRSGKRAWRMGAVLLLGGWVVVGNAPGARGQPAPGLTIPALYQASMQVGSNPGDEGALRQLSGILESVPDGAEGSASCPRVSRAFRISMRPSGTSTTCVCSSASAPIDKGGSTWPFDSSPASRRGSSGPGRSSNVHLYNNYYDTISYFCANVSAGSQILVENNSYYNARYPHWADGGIV